LLIFNTLAEFIPSRRPTEKASNITGGEETSIDRRQVLLSNLSLANFHLVPTRLSPAKGGNAKTIPTRTTVKTEEDADETPVQVTTKSKGKRPQRRYSTPIEISDSENDSPTPTAKPRREEGSTLRSRALENVYVHSSSSVSSILSAVCPLAHPHVLLL
jgi:hypothetical protein